MWAETTFYITGSIFFLLSISILAIIIIYSLKILKKIVLIETEIRDTIAEVKNKVAAFSVGVAGISALLEKIIQMKSAGFGGKDQKKDKRKKDTVE